ncbi:MAG: DUF29 domain-containing protein [Janthinobacterium lividum]
MQPKYEEDFYGWIMANASLLKEGKFNEIDVEHIIEEMLILGVSEKRELFSRLSQLLMHLLKWQYQPILRSHSWMYSIKVQRKQIKIHLKDNPSLKSKWNDILVDAYDIAISEAAKETSLDEKVFPLKCFYSFDQIMDDTFFPD